MRLYVKNSRALEVQKLEVGSYYVFSDTDIIYRTTRGIYLYHLPKRAPGTNIVDHFEAAYPEQVYSSVTELPYEDAILSLRRMIRSKTLK